LTNTWFAVAGCETCFIGHVVLKLMKSEQVPT